MTGMVMGCKWALFHTQAGDLLINSSADGIMDGTRFIYRALGNDVCLAMSHYYKRHHGISSSARENDNHCEHRHIIPDGTGNMSSVSILADVSSSTRLPGFLKHRHNNQVLVTQLPEVQERPGNVIPTVWICQSRMDGYHPTLGNVTAPSTTTFLSLSTGPGDLEQLLCARLYKPVNFMRRRSRAGLLLLNPGKLLDAMFAFLYLPFVVFVAFVAAAPVAHDAAPSQALSKATESGSGQKSDKPGLQRQGDRVMAQRYFALKKSRAREKFNV
ncbi:hypothetical protein BC629DRAFT_1442111 [Irpex lacteus]|nr:hypothetical protein BC629DRAFT_1442111 [Irpex lacteus]